MSGRQLLLNLAATPLAPLGADDRMQLAYHRPAAPHLADTGAGRCSGAAVRLAPCQSSGPPVTDSAPVFTGVTAGERRSRHVLAAG